MANDDQNIEKHWEEDNANYDSEGERGETWTNGEKDEDDEAEAKKGHPWHAQDSHTLTNTDLSYCVS